MTNNNCIPYQLIASHGCTFRDGLLLNVFISILSDHKLVFKTFENKIPYHTVYNNSMHLSIILLKMILFVNSLKKLKHFHLLASISIEKANFKIAELYYF